MNMKVQILSTKSIFPSSPTPPHLKELKLSSFDLIGSSLYGTSILFYPAETGVERGESNAKRSEQLQKSLSEILTIYYPLAGRYIDDKFLIDCNDKGAEYLEAHVSCSLFEFVERAETETKLRNLLVPYIFQLPNSPMLLVQFNMFECGGIAIGVCFSHRIGDGFTATAFISYWANACRVGIETVPSPNFELGSICPPRHVSSTMAAPSDERKIVTRSLVFKRAAIAKLKAVVNANCDDPELLKRPWTGIEVVKALVWKVLISVSRTKHGCFRPSVLVFPFNLRVKTAILPENCCGNLVCLAVGQEFSTKDGNVQLNDMVSYIRETQKRAFTECAKASNAEELFLMTSNAAKELNDAAAKSDVDVFVFNNLHGFPMYEIDFGWGNAYKVNLALYPMELIFFLHAKDGDGIESWVSLEENDMLLFQQHSDIVAYTATLSFEKRS